MIHYDVTGYYDTGFNKNNIPYGPEVLRTATRKSFPAIYHWQDRDLSYVEIQANFNDVADIDYLQVGSSYYFVTNITMESETRCARLDLELDGLTTCGGINGIRILSGWAERWSNESPLFQNVIDEPFTPQQDLVLEQGVEIKLPASGKKYRDLVGATINLDYAEKVADEYKTATSENQVLVPVVPPTTEGTKVVMSISGVTKTDQLMNTLPNLTLYEFEKVKGNISSVRSLGLDSSITACYRIPEEYRGASYNGGISTNSVDKIYNATGVVDSGITFKYGNYKHNKTYSGQFNRITLSSICSGDSADFRSDEIYDGASATAKFIVWADVSPKGCPFARPQYYLGNTKDPFLQCVKGMQWQNTPVVFTEASGYAIENYEFMREKTKEAVGKVPGTLSSLAKLDFGSAYEQSIGWMWSNTNEAISMETRQKVVSPSVVFPRDESIQNFIGNSFYAYRTRLSDADSERFDKFITMYGEAINKKLEKSDFNYRVGFDYVKATNVNLEAGPGLRTRLIAQKQLEDGVRVWHVLPDSSYYENNPLKTA